MRQDHSACVQCVSENADRGVRDGPHHQNTIHKHIVVSAIVLRKWKTNIFIVYCTPRANTNYLHQLQRPVHVLLSNQKTMHDTTFFDSNNSENSFGIDHFLVADALYKHKKCSVIPLSQGNYDASAESREVCLLETMRDLIVGPPKSSPKSRFTTQV